MRRPSVETAPARTLPPARSLRSGLAAGTLAALTAVAAVSLATTSGFAQSAPPSDVKGLWITTDFPSLGLRAGEETKLNLNIVNYNLAPQRADVSLSGVPQGWTAELRGAGKPVAAAFVEHNAKASLELRLRVPADAKPGDYTVVVKANAPERALELPIRINLQAAAAAKLTAEPKLPVLRGTPKSSFDFKVTVKNESADDILANITHNAPRGYQVTFKEGYGTQELTSLPLKAGDSKELSVDIKPSVTANAAKVPVDIEIGNERARASTQLTLDISGQPSVTLAGENDRLSGEVYAGRERRFNFVLRNTGSADARNIEMSATPPSGWKVNFEPKSIPAIAPNGEQKVEALIVPSEKAVTGDYMVAIRANGDGVSEKVDFRSTVATSTLWGAVGLGVIAAALLVLFGAVGRFGRR